jgi:hypothetical protein
MSSRMCFVAAAAVVAALIMFDTVLTTPAFARWKDFPNSGYCPPGTCNRIGGWRALDVRYCSPANCLRTR